MAEKKLFLLDAYALIYRGYYVFIKNPMINSKGFETSAVLGFVNTLMQLLRKERPTHIGIAFDTPEQTERHIIFPEYKAHRDKTPDPITEGLTYIRQIVDAFGIEHYSIPGYEADDIIGTLAKKAEKSGFNTYMVTPDKDYCQLVSESTLMYKPARIGNGFDIMGIEQVCEKFEINNVSQVIDYLAMVGDSSDNIPGLPGIGDKTAKKFLKEYDSIEGLFNNTDKLKGKLKEKVEANREIGMLSKRLVTINTDVPVDFDEDKLLFNRIDIPRLLEIFKDLEFNKHSELLIDNFGGAMTVKTDNSKSEVQLSLFSDVKIEDENDIKVVENNSSPRYFYQLVDTIIAKKLLIENILKRDSFSFKLLSASQNALELRIMGIAFSYEKNMGYYLPFPTDQIGTDNLIGELAPIFKNKEILKIGYDLKQDIKILKKYGVDVEGELFDITVAHHLINPDIKQDIDVLCKTYLDHSSHYSNGFIDNRNEIHIPCNTPLKREEIHFVESADIAFQIKNILEKKIQDNDMGYVFKELEMPLLRVLADMELEGINLDENALKQQSEEIEKEISILDKKIKDISARDFNISSPKQLGEVLFDELKLIEKPKKTKTGQYSTSEETLAKLAKDHEIVKYILEYRSLQKLQSTYVNALPLEIDKNTGRIHTCFNQTVTATGRLSSNKPNLQNIPIKTDRGKRIREAFIPRDDNHVLLSADYSQIELRLMASMSDEKNMIEAFHKGEDIHRSTASRIFNISSEDVNTQQRSHAKTVNFGIIYGVSAFGLSRQTDLSNKESAAMIESYNKSYPRLKEYMNEVVEIAREKSFVQTLVGRRRYLKDINSINGMIRSSAERMAINTPIQGTAADIIKIAMIDIHKSLLKGNFKTKMLLQVHDELIFDVPLGELEQIKILVKDKMENAYKVKVPIQVDMGIGKNWAQAH
ncbi:DNA polymerase I [Ichthyobacterium seriolicida]|uniref:DNA polymerase I n=2 Tax=Ichthyobacterium seriolicida TaxID=242600 RepID=A0A1J1DZX7_9FLAO|nr:DNA polymerase I [Ichthyobacterium seriolicida]